MEKELAMVKKKPSGQSEVETLSQYVKRIMQEKQLKAHDVEVRSGKGIADAYVVNIMNGLARNPSVDKLKALAVGLGEPEEDVFLVARGLPLSERGQRRGGDPWPAHVLLKAMDRIVASLELTRIVQSILQMSPKEVKGALKFIESKRKPEVKE
jgi:transcriptional regulator with XRE-family HTH domain